MIRYKCGYKYQLYEDYEVQTKIIPIQDVRTRFLDLTERGLLTIRAGYAWDGPSGPAIDTATFMRASLVHDALYQLIREGFLERGWRDEADNEMRRICVEDGMSRFRAWYAYHAVSVFGGRVGMKPRSVHVAPKGGDR